MLDARSIAEWIYSSLLNVYRQTCIIGCENTHALQWLLSASRVLILCIGTLMCNVHLTEESNYHHVNFTYLTKYAFLQSCYYIQCKLKLH